MTKDELQSRVAALKWYHAISLPHGITTPGIFPLYPDFYKLPADLTGMRVLDVGAWDGYWTFECLKRGAAHVTAIDDFSDAIYEGERRSWAQFDLCAEAFGFDRKISRREFSVYDLADEANVVDDLDNGQWWSIGRFDLILFLGMLYHCRHPLLALDRLRERCAPGALLLVESHICDDFSAYRGWADPHGDKMVMEFYPGNQLAGCATNWFAPTLKCMGGLIEAAGFEDVKLWKIDNPGELPYCRGFASAMAPG